MDVQIKSHRSYVICCRLLIIYPRWHRWNSDSSLSDSVLYLYAVPEGIFQMQILRLLGLSLYLTLNGLYLEELRLSFGESFSLIVLVF